MSELFNVRPLVERAFAAGRAAGRKEGFKEGHEEGFKEGIEEGYESALVDYNVESGKILDELEERVDQGKTNGPAPDSASAFVLDFNEVVTVFDELRKSSLPPYQQRALEYLQANPGTTAWKASKHLNNNQSVFSKMEKLGLVRKEGPRFYPLP